MQDMLGKELRIGDRICYGGRYGSTQGYLAVGEILRFNDRTISVQVIKHSGHVEEGATSVVQRPDRVVRL